MCLTQTAGLTDGEKNLFRLKVQNAQTFYKWQKGGQGKKVLLCHSFKRKQEMGNSNPHHQEDEKNQ